MQYSLRPYSSLSMGNSSSHSPLGSYRAEDVAHYPDERAWATSEFTDALGDRRLALFTEDAHVHILVLKYNEKTPSTLRQSRYDILGYPWCGDRNVHKLLRDVCHVRGVRDDNGAQSLLDTYASNCANPQTRDLVLDGIRKDKLEQLNRAIQSSSVLNKELRP